MGTLYIAGDGIAQGYLNDKEKTKEKFVVLDRTKGVSGNGRIIGTV